MVFWKNNLFCKEAIEISLFQYKKTVPEKQVEFIHEILDEEQMQVLDVGLG